MACDRCSSPCQGKYCSHCEVAVSNEDMTREQAERAVFHLVCRDCTTEELFPNASLAHNSADAHERETGHETAYARVA